MGRGSLLERGATGWSSFRLAAEAADCVESGDLIRKMTRTKNQNERRMSISLVPPFSVQLRHGQVYTDRLMVRRVAPAILAEAISFVASYERLLTEVKIRLDPRSCSGCGRWTARGLDRIAVGVACLATIIRWRCRERM